jgi:RNA-binding protein
MIITVKQKHWLRAQAHHLKPVVTLGQAGLTEAVLAELETALDHHELLKVKVGGADREERDAIVRTIAGRTGSELIQRIGNTATFYRANPRKKAPLEVPKL